jgi:LPXTG-motif cell wall-anchored protein
VLKKFTGFIAISVLVIASFANINRASAVTDTCTWTGATNANWSTASNWNCSIDGAAIPENGDSLQFPVSASNFSNNNDIVGLSVAGVYVLGTGYTFGGNSLTVTDIYSFSAGNNNLNHPLAFNNTSASTILSNTGNNQINQNVSLTATGQTFNISLSNSDTLTFGSSVVVSGAASSVNINGAGTIVTGTTNWTYTAGNVQLVTGATVDCRMNQCFGDTANNVLLSGATPSIRLGTASLIVPNALSITGNNTSGNLLATNTSGASPRWSGAITLSSNATFSANHTSAILALSNINLGSNTAFFTGVGGVFSSGVISGNGGLDIAMTSNRATLSGNNTYDGPTVVRSGSQLYISNNNALGSTVGATTIESGATLSASSSVANLTFPENITISGNGLGGAFSNGAITHEGNAGIDFDHTYSGTITLAGDTKITHVGATSTDIIINNLAGTGNITFIPSAFGDSLRLAGSTPNTYVGTITVNGSFLRLLKNGAVTGNINVADTVMNAFVDIDVAVPNGIADTAIVNGQITSSSNFNVDASETETIGGLSGDLNAFIAGTLTLNLAGSQTFAGSFNGGGTVVKTGGGTQTLTGDCSSNGQFNVTAGTLVLGPTFTTASCDAVINGGTLKGSGAINDVTALSGRFNAGTSPGVMNMSGNLTLSSGATFDQEIDGSTAGSQYDQTVVTGTATLGNANLNVLLTTTPSDGTVFTILTAGSVAGTFNGLADGATLTVNGVQFRINYTATTVTLTKLGGTLASTGQNNIFYSLIGFVLMASALLTSKVRKQTI